MFEILHLAPVSPDVDSRNGYCWEQRGLFIVDCFLFGGKKSSVIPSHKYFCGGTPVCQMSGDAIDRIWIRYCPARTENQASRKRRSRIECEYRTTAFATRKKWENKLEIFRIFFCWKFRAWLSTDWFHQLQLYFRVQAHGKNQWGLAKTFDSYRRAQQRYRPTDRQTTQKRTSSLLFLQFKRPPLCSSLGLTWWPWPGTASLSCWLTGSTRRPLGSPITCAWFSSLITLGRFSFF